MSTQTAPLIADIVVGGVLVVASLGRLKTPSGALLALAGALWWLGDLVPAATFLHRGVLIHLVLSHPSGRLRGSAVKVTVAIGYVDAAIVPLASNDVASLIVAAAVPVVALHRHLVTTGPQRRSTSFALAASVSLSGALAVGPVTRLAGIGAEATVLAIYDLLIVGVAVLVVTDVLWGGSAGARLTGLVVDLGDATGSDVVRDRLAAGLGDPSLVVGYWLPAQGVYVDGSGRAVEPLPPGGHRTMTSLVVRGQPVAMLDHDSAVLADPRLLADVTAAAGWAVANVRLRAEVRARVDSIEASRRRILTVEDDARRRLEEELQQGTGRRLARVAELVGAGGSCLAGLAPDVARARSDLRELARGLHPRSVTEHGLAGGLGELAQRFPLPVQIDVPTFRLPAATETALYYACAEALTNVLKYAHATYVQVRVTVSGEHVSAVVADDGVGGADAGLGSGLRGLADRAEALGGRCEVRSPVDGGTRVAVDLPLFPSVVAAATLPI